MSSTISTGDQPSQYQVAVRIETSISHRSTTGGKSGYLKEIVRIRLKVSQLGRAKPRAEPAPKVTWPEVKEVIHHSRGYSSRILGGRRLPSELKFSARAGTGSLPRGVQGWSGSIQLIRF
jgi:hypothetical protein